MSDGSLRRLAPLGIGYLAAVLKASGHEPLVPNLRELSSPASFITKLRELAAGLVGITSTTDTFQTALQLAHTVKSNMSDIPIVLGGYHATGVGGKETLKRWPNLFDYVIEGEGEYSLVSLATALEKDGDLDSIDGLAWRAGDTVRSNPPRPISDLDLVPFPLRGLLPVPASNPLHKFGLDVSLVSSRGCSHRCFFCSVALLTGHRWRARSTANVLQEIDQLVEQYGGSFFLHFTDDNFFVLPERAAEIVSSMHRKHPEIVFSFATRSDQLLRGSSYLPSIRESGCVSIELGVENGSQSVLDRFGKGITVKQNIQAIDAIRDSGMEPGVDYIMFEPDETIAELAQNVSFMKVAGLWGDFPALVFSSLALYPGTPITTRWLSQGGEGFRWDSATPCPFTRAEVSDIYHLMQKFGRHRGRVFELLQVCSTAPGNEASDLLTTAKIQAARLKCLPYDVFEQLVDLGQSGWSPMEGARIVAGAAGQIEEIAQSISGVRGGQP